MPSYLHEALLQLLRNSSSPPELLDSLEVEMLEYNGVRIESADLTDLKPAEYRADMVMALLSEGRPVLGIIVEVQLSIDERKKYAWPAYVANLRARMCCPVCLLIVTIEERVERWAAQPVDLGGCNRIVPRVVGPSNIPAITELQRAEANVELAVLSAVAHGNDKDVLLAARIASTAITASAGLDAERSRLYLDLIFKTLSEDAQRALGAMNPTVREYISDFARQHVAEGLAKGREEGRADIVLRLLTLRFGPLPEPTQTHIRDACSTKSETLLDHLLTAQSLEEALSAM
jgi:hypothetical protein